MEYKCEVCGNTEDSEADLSVFHRGCRFSQIFERDKEAEKKLGIKEGDPFVCFDVSKIKKGVKKNE